MTISSSNPKVRVIWHTPDPRKQIAIAARVCYTNMTVDQLTENITPASVDKMVNKILESRHLSVLRHVSFMFSVSDVSRAFSHQLVRHGPGNAFEQRSQHYRVENDFEFVVPSTIPSRLVERYTAAMADDQTLYDELLEAGVPKEDARQVLPNACLTQLVWTANLEAILNFVKVRACRVNCTEIIQVAVLVRRLVSEVIPEMTAYLGPTCHTQGMCFEGEKYFSDCNRPWKRCVLWSPEFPSTIKLVSVNGESVIETK